MRNKILKVFLNVALVLLILAGVWGIERLIDLRNQRLQREAAGFNNSGMTESEYLAQQSSENNETDSLAVAQSSSTESSTEENNEDTGETSSFTRFVPEEGERVENVYDGFYELGDTIELYNDQMDGLLTLTILDCRILTEDEKELDSKKFQGVDGQPVWAWTYEDGTQQRYVYPQFVQDDGSFLDGISLLMVRVRVENVDAQASEHAASSYGGQYNFNARTLMRMLSSKWMRASYASPWYRIEQHPAYFSEMNGVFSESEADHAWIYTLEPGETTEFVLGFYLSDRYARGEEELSEIRFVIHQLRNNYSYQYLINPHLE